MKKRRRKRHARNVAPATPPTRIKKANARLDAGFRKILKFMALAYVLILFVLIYRHGQSSSMWRGALVSYFVFFVGASVEIKRLSENQFAPLALFFLSAIFSLIGFIPLSSSENWIDSSLDRWLGIFTFVFFLMGLALGHKKLTPQIGEGSTLLHSLALFYFCSNFALSHHWAGSGAIISALFLMYSLAHVFTSMPLNDRNRLWLSLWSSTVMCVFGFVYINRVLNLQSVEELVAKNHFGEGLVALVECFLLGASGPYALYNAFLPFRYLHAQHLEHYEHQSGKGLLFKVGDVKGFETLGDLNAEQIQRYSSEQVGRSEAGLVFFLVGGLFLANYFMNAVDPIVAISASFVLVPPGVALISRRLGRREVTANAQAASRARP